jgi:hypothetical protein
MKVTISHSDWVNLWQLSGFLQGIAFPERDGEVSAAAHFDNVLREVLPVYWLEDEAP